MTVYLHGSAHLQHAMAAANALSNKLQLPRARCMRLPRLPYICCAGTAYSFDDLVQFGPGLLSAIHMRLQCRLRCQALHHSTPAPKRIQQSCCAVPSPSLLIFASGCNSMRCSLRLVCHCMSPVTLPAGCWVSACNACLDCCPVYTQMPTKRRGIPSSAPAFAAKELDPAYG